ncbi:phage tail protein [Mycolicibacterium mucogenicum]|uniref:Phage tail protein n=1 Tax=Mycolicibacterium mucogenicum TaxID=56689 RepID=A0A1A3GZ04_MYCMU|nr:phage tail protein [Mycolicibacterium mucogenicum]OBJ40579.1 phage tail protein [Mycolicibacterium mucogenicum]
MSNSPAGLATPHPLGSTLPALYLGDDFAQQLCAAFDDVLAPIFAILDCFPAYLDAGTAPEDMLDWLAGWIGLTLDNEGGAARKRASIAMGAAVLAERGTARSVREAVRAAFNVETDVVESGATSWSTSPDSEPAGEEVPDLLVVIVTGEPDSIDRRRLDEVIRSAKPAHVPHRIEIVAPRSDDPDQSG